MTVLITAEGTLRCLYTEELDLTAFGKPSIQRVSHVEPCGSLWTADMRPVGLGVFGPFLKRSKALKLEAQTIEANLENLPLEPTCS